MLDVLTILQVENSYATRIDNIGDRQEVIPDVFKVLKADLILYVVTILKQGERIIPDAKLPKMRKEIFMIIKLKNVSCQTV